MNGKSRWLRWFVRALVLSAGLALLLLGLFVCNGLNEGWREPEVTRLGEPRAGRDVRELKVMAFNIAKASMYEGGLKFAEPRVIRERLDKVAALIRAASPDLVCLSEVVIEAGPAEVAQAEYLAEACGFAYMATSENYSFGLPFYRIRSGNVILSKYRLEALAVVQLIGGTPFWKPTNNRRVLWCRVKLDSREILVASLRNDSFDPGNNHAQLNEIIRWIDGQSAILAGDFNADEHSAAMKTARECGEFTGAFDSPPTFPASAPKRCIDYVLAPASWTLISHQVIPTLVSDHRAVMSTFRLP